MSVITPEQLAAPGTEHAHQTALFAWAALNVGRFPELALLFAIPNGGERNKIVAARLKAEGAKAGMLDMMLPVARQGMHGLFIELKRPSSVGKRKGLTSDKQDFWIDELHKQGYGACSCIGWEDARDILVLYLS